LEVPGGRFSARDRQQLVPHGRHRTGDNARTTGVDMLTAKAKAALIWGVWCRDYCTC
jgi:hypothetical protein